MGLISKKLGKKSKKKIRAASVALAAGFTFLPFLGGCKDKAQQADLPTTSTEQVVDSSVYEELEKTIEDLKNQLAATNGKVDMLSSMYGELYTKVTSLLSKYEELLAKVNSNSEDVEGLKGEISALLAEVAEIKTKIENNTGAEIDNGSIKELDEKLCKLIILSSAENIRSRFNRIDYWYYQGGENTEYACIYTDNLGNYACAETHSGCSYVYEDSIAFAKLEDGTELISKEESYNLCPFVTDIGNYNISSQDGKIVMESTVEGASFEIEVDSNLQITSCRVYRNDSQLVGEIEYSLGYDYWYEGEVEDVKEKFSMYAAYKDVKTAVETSYSDVSYLKVVGEGVMLDGSMMQATMMYSKSAGAGYATSLYDDPNGESWVYQKGSKSESVDVYSNGEIIEYESLMFDISTDNAATFIIKSCWDSILKYDVEHFKSVTYNEEKGVYVLSFDDGVSFEITINELGNITEIYQDLSAVENSSNKSISCKFMECTKEEFAQFFKEAKDKITEYKAQKENDNADNLEA